MRFLLPDRHDEGRPGERAASNVTTGNTVSIPDFDNWSRRVIQDALNESTRAFWLKRAEDFERAKPRPDEYHGNKTREQLRAQWLWCHETAQACRNKAVMVSLDDDAFDADLSAMLDGEAA